jgi:mannosyltransferase
LTIGSEAERGLQTQNPSPASGTDGQRHTTQFAPEITVDPTVDPTDAAATVDPTIDPTVAATSNHATTAAVIVLSAVVAAGAVLRHLGAKPLWRDEAISVSIASRPVLRLLSILPHHDANAGLYYLLLHGWLRMASGPTAARGLSAACFIATAAGAAWAATHWRGWETGLACGLLIAVNPFLVYYGQEARPYALAVLLAAVSTVALFWRGRGPAPRAYVVTTVALLYADLFAILYVGALALVLVVGYRLRGEPVPAALKRCWWIIAGAAAPLAAVMMIFERAQISWLGRPRFQDLTGTLTSMTSGWLGLSIVTALAVLALLPRRRATPEGSRTVVAALAVAFVLPPLGLWTLSQLSPSYVDRYVIASTLGAVVLAAAGLAVLRRRGGRAVAGAVLAGLVVLGGQRTARLEAQPFKVDNAPALVRYVRRQAQPGDAMAYAGGGLRIVVESAVATTGALPPDIALAPGGQEYLQSDIYAREVSAAELLRRLAPVQRLWLVTDPADQRFPQGGPFAQSKALIMTSFDFGPTTTYGAIDLTLLMRHP